MKALSLLLTFVIAVSLIFGSLQSIQSSNIKEKVTGTPPGWTDDIRLTDNAVSDRKVRLDVDDSDIHLTWRRIDGNMEVFHMASNDSGNTWGVISQISNSGVGADNPDIAQTTGNTHIVWDDTKTLTAEIYYRNSTDNGVTWNAERTISSTDGFNSEAPRIAVSNSNVHVIWVDERHGAESVPANTEIYYNRSLDGGVTWEGEQRLTNAPFASAPNGIGVNGSNVHIIWVDGRSGSWEIYYKMSPDNGATWQDGQGNVGTDRLLTTNTTVDHVISSLAVNGSTVHVVWVDQVWPGPVYYMYYRNSMDNGFSWNPVQLLSGPSPVISNPDITAWGDNVSVVWADTRDDGSTSEIYYKNSTDGGATWSPDLRLTYNEGNDSWGPKIALDNSTVHVAWHDGRDSNYEIYYKRHPDFPTDTMPPSITHTPVTESPIDQTIEITANITDDVAVSNVTLYYENVDDTTYTAVDMVLVSGDWAATIPAQTETGLVHYFIWANDTSGNAAQTIVYQIQINDITDPEIYHIPVNSANVFDVINITANITDDVAVDRVFLNYTGTNGTNCNVSMNKWDGNYSFEMPGQSNTGIVSYFIWANDTSGNDNWTSTYQIQIFDITDPVINHVPVTSANISETINITANITDDVGVDAVCLNYTDVHGVNYNVSMSLWNGNWSYEIPGQNTIGNVQYFIWADDTSGNDNQTVVYQIQINDITKPEIEHTPVTSANVSEVINITAQITDDVEVDSVYLNYTGIDGINHNVSMTKWNGNWSFEIPGQAYAGTINYFIWCNDTSGNPNQTATYQVQINEVIIPDTTPPIIISTTPTGVNVSITTTITITFNESMNTTSVQSAIAISPAVTISGYGWNADNTTLTIIPSGNLSYNTTYNITVGIGAKDIGGNNLASVYSWEFTTQSEPEIPPPPVVDNWWIGIIIFLVAVIILLLLYLFNKEKEP